MKKRKSPATPSALLFYDSPERDADLLYLGRFFAPDAFLALYTGDQAVAVLHALEIARGVRESEFDLILSYETCFAEANKCFPKASPLVAVTRWVLREFGLEAVRVSPRFPAGLAFDLRKAGVGVTIAEGAVFPQRLIKSDQEAAFIKAGCKASAAGLNVAETVLAGATIKRGWLYHDGRRLTSERLRARVDAACLEHGAVAGHTIVAGGDQACDPHCMGSGPLRANQLIIVDVFPRVSRTGYHGDMTRTFLKGKASEEQRRLVAAVREAQRIALKRVKHGVDGASVHRAVCDYFSAQGYITKRDGTTPVGFFHSTGHGLGLDVHEDPRLSVQSSPLKSGMVVTVEPGLYYPGLGGCRIEDVVRCIPGGRDKLSSYPYRWELA